MKLWSSKNPAGRDWPQEWLKKRMTEEIADVVLALSKSTSGWSDVGKLDAGRVSPQRLAELIVATLRAGDNDTQRIVEDLIEHLRRQIEIEDT
jgi:hypothetical protein